ncbi:ABC transporter substrate-binding protein [Georgenia sp. Z1491]|uniref:ABC transporter substrate-binding protein n=1 Tax=Georgenia sp. Z1491 TaxID=3416707 RepID=UPI003CF1C925
MSPLRSRRRSYAAGATLAASALVLAACGGGDSEGEGGGDGDELTPITVGVIPIIDVAPLYIGIEEGIFEEHGLDVTAESGQGGAAIVPSVVSGDFDFGFGNSMSTVIAASTGMPLQIIASGVWSTGDPEEDGFTIMSADESIQGPEDLEGAVVATNTLNAIGDSVVMESAELAGVDPTTIEFVEMPFNSMPAAMENGDVDAAWIVEPFVTVAMEDSGAHVVTAVLLDIADEWEIATYFTTDTYANDNQETVEAFQAAISEANAYAQENPDAVREILQSYLDLPDGLEDRVILPGWQPEVSRETVQIYHDMADERGLLDQEVDLDALLEHAQ